MLAQKEGSRSLSFTSFLIARRKFVARKESSDVTDALRFESAIDIGL